MSIFKPVRPVVNKRDSLSRGLKLCWAFWERGGLTVYDISEHGYHGTITHASLGTARSVGKYGLRLDIDKTNKDRVVNNDFPAIGTAPKTVMFVFNAHSTTGVHVIGSLSKNAETSPVTDGTNWGFYINGTNFVHWGAGSGYDTTITASFTTGNHIAIATDKGTGVQADRYAFLDTFKSKTTLQNVTYNTQDDFTVSTHVDDDGNSWEADIDIYLACVWDRYLTDNEIRRLLDNPYCFLKNQYLTLGKAPAVAGSASPVGIFQTTNQFWGS